MERLKWEDLEFEFSLSFIRSPYLKSSHKTESCASALPTAEKLQSSSSEPWSPELGPSNTACDVCFKNKSIPEIFFTRPAYHPEPLKTEVWEEKRAVLIIEETF